MDAALSVNALRKHYGKTEVLHGLNLEVTTGAIHGLVGLNGSGKTTTMECVLGMQDFNSGDIRVLGRAPAQLWQGQGDVVGIFDTPGVHSGLTVRQVLEHARLLCPKPVRTSAQVEELLGISRYSRYKIRQLSLGNRRRVSIAHALLGQPAFIVLDEPFNGLDAGGVEDVLALILQLNREEGTSFLLSSHQLAYLESICSHMSILHQGRIALSEKLDTLFKAGESRLTIQCDQIDGAATLLEALPGVSHVARGEHTLSVTLSANLPDNSTFNKSTPCSTSAADINRVLVSNNIAVSELRSDRPGLSRIFHDIVGSPSVAVSREAH